VERAVSQEQNSGGGEGGTGAPVTVADDLWQESDSSPIDVGNVTIEQIGRRSWGMLRTASRLNLSSIVVLVTLSLACMALWNDVMGEEPERVVRRMETKVDSVLVLLSDAAGEQSSRGCVVEPSARP
jgi:hypothetical protein